MQETLSLPTSKETFLKLSRRERAELYEKAVKRIQELPTDERSLYLVDDEKINEDLYFVRNFKAFHNLITEAQDQRSALIEAAQRGEGTLLESYYLDNDKKAGNKNMEDINIRSFQKYLTQGIKNLTDEEQRSLNVSGAAAVIPTQIANQLITNEKYSNLLWRTTQITEVSAGKVYVPIASDTVADWKLENSSVDALDASYDKSPTLTKLELGGREIMRYMSMSAASASLSTEQFSNMMQGLLASEVLSTIEKSFVDGNGTSAPKGLNNLTYVADENLIEATTSIKAVDVAEAMSLLPARYSQKAIVMCNAKTLFDIGQFKGSVEYAFNLAEGATKFLGKEIVLNEFMSDNEIYILDPSEIYVRWAMPLQVETSRDAGFSSATIALRALAVCDFAINPKSVVKVAIAA